MSSTIPIGSSYGYEFSLLWREVGFYDSEWAAGMVYTGHNLIENCIRYKQYRSKQISTFNPWKWSSSEKATFSRTFRPIAFHGGTSLSTPKTDMIKDFKNIKTIGAKIFLLISDIINMLINFSILGDEHYHEKTNIKIFFRILVFLLFSIW